LNILWIDNFRPGETQGRFGRIIQHIPAKAKRAGGDTIALCECQIELKTLSASLTPDGDLQLEGE
jgi:hypothetical protein